MYGACVYGLQTRGIELLPLLASHARDIAQKAGVDRLTFECADMLACDLSEAEILLLASQCWDEALVDQLRSKLLTELEVGTLVIDYTAALGDETKQRTSTAKSFALEMNVSAPVSWDGAHRFWIWRVVSR